MEQKYKTVDESGNPTAIFGEQVKSQFINPIAITEEEYRAIYKQMTGKEIGEK